MSPVGTCGYAVGFLFTHDIYKQLNSCIVTLGRIILKSILDKFGYGLDHLAHSGFRKRQVISQLVE
jgi:hypothetical protein